MKIGVEASAAFRKQKTGVGWYVHDLVMALAQEMPDDELLLCYISFLTKQPEKLNPSPGNVRYKRVNFFPGKIYNALDHYFVPPPIDLLARARADVFLFPNYFRWPLWLCRKSVVVIHDLGFLEAPQFLVPRHQRYMARRVPQSVRKATHVVVVSEHAKSRLVEQYGTSPEKITVVTPALDQDAYVPASAAAVAAVKQKYGIRGEYLLFLGTTDPRKNVDGIVEAYTQLPAELKQRYQLVLAGAYGREWGWGWLDERINQLEKALPQGALVRTGYMAAEDKTALMTGAKIFVWPSHYEGFGMPIVEAMACGAPVLTARNSSLPEAGGAAAAYTETTEAAEISAKLGELLGDPGRLERMRTAGFEHAKAFTWKASAGRMAAALRKAQAS
jgi:glycosyltransferase involved in cell wall biosynthesis